MIRSLFTLFVLALPALAQGRFVWKDHGDGRLELLENGKTALVYNYGPQLKNNAPSDRSRCCYIFPIFTPGGVSMLDDFPKDHWHHHGIFWAWPVVETPQGKYDLWMYKGVQHRFETMVGPNVLKNYTSFVAKNAWYAGDTKIIKESAHITVFPSDGSSRSFEVELTLEAVSQPVTLRGSQERGKSYGGFSARFAPREDTVIRSAEGPVAKDEDLVPHKWAELEAVYGGKKATLRITPDPQNPGFPYQWCLRNYGFAGASFPGRTDTVQGFTIEPYKPLTLKFRVTVSGVN